MVNPASYESLVYQNQSYDDLQLVEQGGWYGYFWKYTSGKWHVPPMYMTLGTLSYMLFGLPPVNAYLVNIFFLFLSSWSVYLLFRYAKARKISSLLGGLTG